MAEMTVAHADQLLAIELVDEIERAAVQTLVSVCKGPGDVARPLLQARNVPDAFMTAAHEGIRDIHNIVRARVDGHNVVLDATWHDEVRPFSFRVNDTWSGTGDTRIAVDVERMLGPSEDPAAEKAKIIASWPADEQARRRRFLEMINNWVAGLSTQPVSPIA